MEGSGRGPILCIIVEFVWAVSGGSWNTSVYVVSVLVEIRTRHFPNTRLKLYRFKETFSVKAIAEKLTVAYVVKKPPAFYGTQSFITVFRRAQGGL
jgi:hypothetical protein